MSKSMNAFIQSLEQVWSEATDIWVAGGWGMIAIAVIAFVMFSVGFRVYSRLRRKGFLSTPERVWRRWIDHPLERKGKIGDLLDKVSSTANLSELTIYFRELRTTESVPFERDLKLMKVCVSAAPLVGLLGTVTGMLATFGALAEGSGGDKTMSMVASGISEALITTETGLVIALPGLFFQYQLARQHERYKAFLAHLESVCTQRMCRAIQLEERAAILRAAREQIARRWLKCNGKSRLIPQRSAVSETHALSAPHSPNA